MKRIAGFVAAYVSGIQVAVVVTADDIPYRDQSAFEREEWRLLRAQWALLRPAHKKLCDPASLATMLSGPVDVGLAEAKAIVATFNEFARRTRSWLRNHDEYQRRMVAGRLRR